MTVFRYISRQHGVGDVSAKAKGTKDKLRKLTRILKP